MLEAEEGANWITIGFPLTRALSQLAPAKTLDQTKLRAELRASAHKPAGKRIRRPPACAKRPPNEIQLYLLGP